MHKKTKNLPLPRRGRGLGGWGQKGKLRAGRPATNRSSPRRGIATSLPPPAPRPTQPRGCKGRSPLHKKTKNLPLPAGEERSASAGGGMGAEKQANGKVDRQPPGQASAGHSATTRRIRAARSKPPRRTPPPHPPPVPLPAQPRGCKGRSPLHEKTMILPLPRRGRGLGGWGQKGR